MQASPLLISALDKGEYILQEVLGRTNNLLSLTRHGLHRKRRVRQLFYCFVLSLPQ
jgi:hypothetical protein